MKIKKIKKVLCLSLAGIIAASFAACTPQTADVSEIFDADNKISYCTTYKELSEKRKNSTELY